MTIKPGGCDDPGLGLGRRLRHRVLRNRLIYLAAEFVVTAGDRQSARCGATSACTPEGPDLGSDGAQFHPRRAQQRRNVHPQDNSPQAAAARRIQGFHELDGLEFLAARGHREGWQGQDRTWSRSRSNPTTPTTQS